MVWPGDPVHIDGTGQLTNLPGRRSSFVGRDAERSIVQRLLTETRLLTLTGTGGIGKTRLALEVASDALSRHSDGVRLVELAPISEPALVPEAVASALGVGEGSGGSFEATLIRAIRSRRLLLVLDNCEHLSEACAGLVKALLEACPGLQMLTTSRGPLGVAGEIVWRVPPLSVPTDTGSQGTDEIADTGAVALFIERARSALPSFTLDDANAAVVGEICRRLDGIPLAIELAAARLRLLSPAQILERLDDRLRLLTAGDHSAPARQQTLEATLDWSHRLLSPGERSLFRRLAVFAGGWTLEAAESVCAGEPLTREGILDLLASLVDKSLVVVEDRSGAIRFRLLDTIHAYATTRLREAGEEALARRRHQAWYFDLLRDAAWALFGPDQVRWLAQLDAEIDNVRAALDWCTVETESMGAALRDCIPAVWRYWDVRGFLSEAQGRVSALLASAPADAPAGGRALALACLAYFRAMSGEPGSAPALLRESTALAREADDPWALSYALWLVTLVGVMGQDFDGATAACTEVWAISDAIQHPFGSAPWTFWLGEIARQRGDLDQADRLLAQSYAATIELGNVRDLAIVRIVQGLVALQRADGALAEQQFREALSFGWAARDALGIAMGLDALGLVASALGQAERAARLMGAAQSATESMGTAMLPLWHQEHEQGVKASRARLGPSRFQLAFDEGRALSVSRAVDYALKPSKRPSALGAIPGGLSEREREVAVLIGQGFTNREIAETLVIAERTVEAHVTHALGKVGLRSRAQLAVWVSEQGLLSNPTT